MVTHVKSVATVYPDGSTVAKADIRTFETEQDNAIDAAAASAATALSTANTASATATAIGLPEMGFISSIPMTVIAQDASGQAVIAQRADGVDFIPSASLIARFPTGADGTVEFTLSGDVIEEDAAGQALRVIDGTGMDFIPSAGLVGRVGYGAALRTGLPTWAHDLERRTVGGVPMVLYTTDEWRGTLHRYAYVGGLNISLGLNRRMELLASNGQSLAVGTDFTGTGENTTPIDHLGPYHVFDVIDGQEVRGWQSADGRAATSAGLRVAPLPTVRQTPIATAAAAYAEARRVRGMNVRPAIVRNHGYSGQSYVNIDSLSGNDTDAGNVWPTFLNWLDLAVAEAVALGMEPRASFHVLIHGTADGNANVSKATYRGFLDQYQTDVEAAVHAATGQTAPVRLVLMQDAGQANTTSKPWDVAQAQLEKASADPTEAILAGPLYPYPIWDAAVHPGVVATVQFSEIIGHAMAAQDNGERWTIGLPAVSRSGAVITVDYSAQLRGDELLSIAPDPYAGVGCANLGWEWVGGGETITAITVTGAVVTVTLSGTPGSAGTLRYAMQQQNTSSSSPGFTAHRGRIRTTWFAPSLHTSGTLYRWLPSITLTVS